MDEIKDYLEKYTDALVELGRKTEVLEETLKELNKTLNLSLKAAQLQWQPIETAPVKNNYLPEVLCTNGEETAVSFYDRGYWSGFMGDEAQPTHWMPLPPPPQQ